MTMTREDVAALVARLVGKTWYVTDSTGQRWADDAPEDAARALLAALDDLDAVKANATFWENRENIAVIRAEAAEAALAAMTEREERLCRSLRHYMDLAHTGGTEADWFEAHDGATAALTQKGA